MAKQTNEQSYDGSQIQVLEGLEPVRKRPGMYIGSTGYEGVHHLIKEIADNSIDEAIAGYATKVEVTLLRMVVFEYLMTVVVFLSINTQRQVRVHWRRY